MIIWTVLFKIAPNLICNLQIKWFPIPRESLKIILYAYLALFKIFFIIFNLVPFLVLLILS